MKTITVGFAVFFLSVLSLLTPGVAAAQSSTDPTCALTNSTCTQGVAYQKCLDALAYTKTYVAGMGYSYTTEKACTHVTPVSGGGPASGEYICQVNWSWRSNCYAQGTTQQVEFYYNGTCHLRETLQSGNAIFTVSPNGSVCSGGCEFKKPDGNFKSYTFGSSSEYIVPMSGFAPTGQVCALGSAPDPKPEDVCRQEGSLTQCMTNDGKHCATGASGARYCWSDPSDNTPRVNPAGNEYGMRTLSPAPLTAPPTPPPAGGNWNPPSSTGNTTVNNYTTNNNGNTSNTYNVGTGTSSNSSGGGSNNNGGGGTTPGGGGTNPDPGTGAGPCDPTKQTCAPGAGAGAVGSLYDRSDRTLTSVFTDFATRVSGSPLISSADRFLTYTGGGGCPVFTLSGTDYWQAMEFNFHCSGGLATALTLGGYVLLAYAAFKAFQIALY